MAAARIAPLPLPSVEASELKVVRVLAGGGQKRVSLCRWLPRDCDVVHCSVFDAETCGLDPTTIARLRAEFSNECSLLHELGAHRNIMHIFARVNGQLSFIAEYCQGGSLAKQLRAEPPTMDLSACVRVAKSVARAMRFLHSLPAPVVHGDLTSNNVLLTADGVAKLCDFGLSRTQHQTKGLTKVGADRGTTYAMAPEQLDREQQHVTYMADVWSFGCMLIEIFHPKHATPYSQFNPKAVAFQICSGKQPPELAEVVPSALRDYIARKLLIEPPHARASFTEIVRTLDAIFPPSQYPLPAGAIEPDDVTIDTLRARVQALPPLVQARKPEPVKHEPAKHEPAKHEPAKHEPAKAAPAVVKAPAKPQPKPAAVVAKPQASAPRAPAAVAVPRPASATVKRSEPRAAEPPAYLRLTAARPSALLDAEPARPQTVRQALAPAAKKPHSGFWRFPPVGHIKGEWSCCGSTRYHDQFCI